MSLDNVLGPHTGYVDLILLEMKESLEKQQTNGKLFQRTPIRPSGAGKCAREIYFEMLQYSGKAKFPQQQIDPEQQLLLGLGHYIEKHLIDAIRKYCTIADVRFGQQILDFGRIEAVNDTRLSQHLEGSMDLCMWSEKWKCAIDVKSKGDNYDFKSRKQKWEADNFKLRSMKSVITLSDRAFWVEDLEAFLEELQDPFFESNFIQLNMYCNSKFLMDRKVDHGAIFQYQKNKSKLREIRFKPSAKVFDKTIEKLKNVVKAVDENKPELAPCEYTPESFKSRYCDFCKAKVPGSCAMRDKK